MSAIDKALHQILATAIASAPEYSHDPVETAKIAAHAFRAGLAEFKLAPSAERRGCESGGRSALCADPTNHAAACRCVAYGRGGRGARGTSGEVAKKYLHRSFVLI
ncbi:hypothetical protein [Duganella hordei]|uniref:hypothetical protein n=1 Tax=Duganella hordei TaxID=2865934 RepID=UPI003341A43E